MSDFGENTPTVSYGSIDGNNPVYFRICPKCGRFVKPDETTKIPEYQQDKPNATCKKCGRVQMPFCCWESDEILTERNYEWP